MVDIIMRINNKNVSRSKLALENKDFQSAIKYCNEELKKNKKNVDVYLIRGSAYNQLEKTELAIEDFKTAYSLNPSDLEVLKKLFFSYAKVQDASNMIVVCNQIIKQYPSDNDELVFQEICRLLMEREQYDNCLTLLKEIVERSGEHHVYNHLIGLNYFYLRDYKNAIKFMKKALKDSNNIQYLLSLVEAYIRTSESEKGFKDLLIFWGENKHNPEITKEDKITIINTLADLCIKNNNFEGAINWYNELLVIHDKKEEKISIEHKKAHIYKMLKQYNKALEVYQVIIKTSNNTVFEFLECAEIYKRQGFYKEAYEEFKKILYLEPCNINAALGLSHLCLMKHDYVQAKELMEQLSENNKKNIMYLKQCVEIYLELLEREKASEEKTMENKGKLYNLLFELVAINPQDISNFEKLINLYIDDKRYEDAKNLIDKTISYGGLTARILQAYVLTFINEEASEIYYDEYLNIGGEASEVFYYKAKYKYLTNDNQEALILLDQCLSFNPDHIYALELLIQTYIKKREWDEALDTCDTLINIDMYNSEYYFKKAMIYARLKKYEESLNYFQNAILFNNFNLDAIFNLGNVYFKLENFEESLKCYKIIIYLNPDYNREIYSRIAKIYDLGG